MRNNPPETVIIRPVRETIACPDGHFGDFFNHGTTSHAYAIHKDVAGVTESAHSNGDRP
jgi:hypothetical protein